MAQNRDNTQNAQKGEWKAQTSEIAWFRQLTVGVFWNPGGREPPWRIAPAHVLIRYQECTVSNFESSSRYASGSCPFKPDQSMRITKKRLLFVDDEPGIRHTLPLILRRYGFTVMVAGTVTEALDQIKAQPIDVLLCDLNLERQPMALM